MTGIDSTTKANTAPAQQSRSRSDGKRRPSLSRAFIALLPFAIALFVYVAAFDHIRAQLPTGDEPSYLEDAMSMARDGDRDLTNQVAHPRQLTEVLGAPYAPHAYRYTSAGLISWHGAGVGVLIVPGVWIGDAFGDTLLWVRIELILIDALAALLLFEVLRRLGSALGIRPVFVWVAWASVALSLPVVVFADQVYPEIPALLFILIAVLAMIRPSPGWRTVAVGSCAASFLPWLHFRFTPVCLALLLGLAIRGIGALARTQPPQFALMPGRTELGSFFDSLRTRAGMAVLVAAIAPGVVSLGLMAYKFNEWYGSPSWTAMNRTSSSPSLSAAYSIIVGGLLSPDFGWLPFAPVYVIGLAGLACLWILAPRWTTYGIIVALGYQAVLALSGLATPGFTFPGRYELACLPFLAIPLVVVLARVPAAWVGFVPLLLVSIALTVNASQHSGVVLLNRGEVNLPLAQHLQSAWPDTEQPAVSTAFVAGQATEGHLIGRVLHGPGLPHGARTFVESRATSRAGFLSIGPGKPLAPGAYSAQFSVARTDGPARGPLATVEVWATPGVTLGTRRISAGDLPADGRYRDFAVPFGTPGGLPIETRIFTFGRAPLRAADIRVSLVAPGGQYAIDSSDRYPKAALATLWLSGIAFLGALFLGAMTRRPRLRGLWR
jgi:hypothetical protein